MNRWKAGGVHFIASFCVVGCFAIPVFLLWYPGAIAVLEGVSRIFLLLLAVDVVLGPLLTMIVYAPQKKNLQWDMAVIISIQLAALVYGAAVLISQRPAFMVFSVDRFVIVAESDISRENAQYPEFKKAGLSGPQFVGADIFDPEEKEKHFTAMVLEGQKDREFLSQYYHPYTVFKDQVIAKASRLNSLKLDGGRSRQVEQLARVLNTDHSQLGFLPIVGKAKDMVAVIDLNSARVVDYLDMDPWQ